MQADCFIPLGKWTACTKNAMTKHLPSTMEWKIIPVTWLLSLLFSLTYFTLDWKILEVSPNLLNSMILQQPSATFKRQAGGTSQSYWNVPPFLQTAAPLVHKSANSEPNCQQFFFKNMFSHLCRWQSLHVFMKVIHRVQNTIHQL